MDHGKGGVRFRASVEGFRGRAEYSWDPLNNSESISYHEVSVLTLVLAAFFFGLGTWLGLWMSQLEERYTNG